MIALSLSIAVLFLAPVLARSVAARPTASTGFDGFALTVSFGAVILGLLPEVVEETGAFGMVFVLFGLLLPSLAEVFFHRSADGTHKVSLIMAAAVLVLHAAADGAILAGLRDQTSFLGQAQSGFWITIPLILHRFGVALALWWLLRPYLSRSLRWAILIALALSTLVGFYALDASLDTGIGAWIDFLLAFGCGGLLHILLHPVAGGETPLSGRGILFSHRVGTVMGLIVVVTMTMSHAASHTVGVPDDHTSHRGHDHAIQHSAHQPAHQPASQALDRVDSHNHGPDPSLGDGAAGPHGLDHLLHAGLLLSPFLVGLFLVWPLASAFVKTPPSGQRSWMCISVGLGLFLWLTIGLSAPDFVQHHMPQTAFSEPLWFVWQGVSLCVLVFQGARPFLHNLLPLGHDHAHSH